MFGHLFPFNVLSTPSQGILPRKVDAPMTTHAKTQPQPGKRRKTFTGCWTCRSRRLRCDETKPACIQCISKNLACAGYTTRLQWLPPRTGSGEQACSLIRIGTSQRRQVLANIPTSILGDAILDEELNAIDAEEPLSACQTRLHGPFSVFRVNKSSAQHHTTQPEPVDEPPSVGTGGPTKPTSQAPYWSSTTDGANPNLEPLSENIASTQGSLDECWTASDMDYPWPDAQFSPGTSLSPSFGDLLTNDDQCEDSFEAHNTDSLSSQHPCTKPSPYRSDSSLATYQLKPTFMTPDNHILLNHYITTAVHLFTVVENCKSPWRTLHLPRALQGVGELEATGSTPNARNALLHTILSVSANILVNKYRIQGQEETAKKWCKKALYLRFRAVNLLKNCLQEDVPLFSKKRAPAKPKYKELLAAMLSMITIDVASGDTRTCRIHLKGCESLIRSAKRGKRKHSAKACALHRIFYYLRVIHASTALPSELTKESSEPRTPTEEQQNQLSSNLKEAEGWLELEQRPSSIDDISSCEFVYGIPLDLLLLMGKTTGVVQQVNVLRRKQWDLFLMPSMAETCEKLEAEVLDWPVDARLASLSRAPVDPETRLIIEHQTRAVHQGLIIYLSRHIRMMHRKHLQPYVESVITHMEAAEKIKEDSGLITGPMAWQCFIAASEALDESLQKRFVDWFDKTRSYGMEAGTRGRDVVVEVWSQRRLGGSEVITTDWRKVAEAKTAYLMLT